MMSGNGKLAVIDNDEQIDENIIDGGEITGISDREYRVDPIKKQKTDTARKLAFILVAVLAVSIAVQYTLTTWLLVNGQFTAVEAIKDIFSSWLPVISGLTGSAITFFFTRER